MRVEFARAVSRVMAGLLVCMVKDSVAGFDRKEEEKVVLGREKGFHKEVEITESLLAEEVGERERRRKRGRGEEEDRVG